MNRDQFNQLCQAHYSLALKAQPPQQRQGHLEKANFYAQKSIEIWPNFDLSWSIYLRTAEMLKKIYEVKAFYNEKIKPNPFILHPINNILVRFFEAYKMNDLVLDVQIKDFICFPVSRNQVLTLHEKLKQDSRYPNGIFDLLDQKIYNGKTLFKHLTTRYSRTMKVDTFNCLMELLIRNKFYKRAKTLQDFYLQTRLHQMDISRQKAFRKIISSENDFDNTLVFLAGNSILLQKNIQHIQNPKNAWYLVDLLKNHKNRLEMSNKIFLLLLKKFPLEIMQQYSRYKDYFDRYIKEGNFKDFIINLQHLRELKFEKPELKNKFLEFLRNL
jgi:tetratricopeptide (TPR) repeat protein